MQHGSDVKYFHLPQSGVFMDTSREKELFSLITVKIHHVYDRV